MKFTISNTCMGLLFVAALLPAILVQPVFSQQPVYPYKSFHDFRSALDRITNISDNADRNKQVDELWNKLKSDNQIPFRLGDSVAFLY